MGFLTEDLLTDIKSRSFAPISQTTFTDSDLLDIANRQLAEHIVPQIMQVREDFFQKTKSTTITSGLARYQLADDAIGNAVKGLYMQDSAGNRTPLARTDSSKGYMYSNQQGVPAKYYFEGDEVVLLPTPTVSGYSLYQEYFGRPNDLVLTTDCAKITSISSVGGTTTFTVDTDLSASLSIGVDVDFLSSKSPFLLWSSDVAITAISATTIAVATTDVQNEVSVTEPQVNDYICPAGYANIAMIPKEWHGVLAQSVAVRLIRSLGDVKRFEVEFGILREMVQDAKLLIQSRAISQPSFISQSNPLLTNFGRW